MDFYKCLSDNKSPQVSRTRLRILAVLSNAVIWIVCTRPQTSKSSRPFNNPLVIVPKAPITIGTKVTFMFHSPFNCLFSSIIIILFSEFFTPPLVDVFHWSLTDSKFPHVFRTLLSILTDVYNAAVCMVSSCPLISKSTSPCTKPFVTVMSAPITNSITVTFMFPDFFQFSCKV